MALDLPDNVLLGRLDHLANWVRSNSLWPMPFATACCGIELMATGASKHDIARFGAEVMRFSPRQCDLMIVAGRVVMKMLPVLQRIWQQMPEPKWCISMGACASSGGVFDTYAVVQGVDRFLPVDIYVPGCHSRDMSSASGPPRKGRRRTRQSPITPWSRPEITRGHAG
jgi:NADH-quinone oxidoreductase subunit B